MKRRDFFGFTAMLSSGLMLSACGGDDVTAATVVAETPAPTKPSGAVTLYYEIRVPGPEKSTVLSNIDTLISIMKAKKGYLSFSLKQVIGESTMVKNYPNNTKGVLGEGFVGNAKVPNFYSIFMRFDSYDNMLASGAQAWFEANIVPSLFAYNTATTPPTKSTQALDYYEGIFVTVAAGDRKGIYTSPEQINEFLRHQANEVTQSYITVENHVMIKDINVSAFNQKIQVLLTTAQQTYMPMDGGMTGYGTAGTLDVSDKNYRKAVTTEILQNAFADGELRSYLMHGVWESIADHENSHIDPRFQQAAGPTGAYVVVGPVEPFYMTLKQDGLRSVEF